MAAKLSVIIPCLDVANHIRACVESANRVADEVLIADSGSTDGTLELARTLPNCRVIEGPWLGYAQFKNWALPQAKHEWVLFVDSDERVTPELAVEVRESIAKAPADVHGFQVGFRCFFLGHELRYSGYNSPALRLFRKDCGRYGERPVHEAVQMPPQHVRKLKQRLLHYSFWSYDECLDKWSRYSRLSATHLQSCGVRAGFAQLSLRPLLRFLHLYLLRGGCLDGAAGLQVCMLSALFVTFAKQTRLWEAEQAGANPNVATLAS